MQYETAYIETNGIKLHVVMAGPKDGQPVILLHGFPEFWYGWRKQIPVLAEAGYRVIVPDQRGYHLSDKPKGVKAYSVDKLAKDILGLMLQIPQGRRAAFDKKTHRRIWVRTNRLTYIYNADRLLEEREPEEITEDVLQHLEDAQFAIQQEWGQSELSRLENIKN